MLDGDNQTKGEQKKSSGWMDQHNALQEVPPCVCANFFHAFAIAKQQRRSLILDHESSNEV